MHVKKEVSKNKFQFMESVFKTYILPYYCKTLIFGGYFYLVVLVVKLPKYETAKCGFEFNYNK